jgi:putative hydrolase of the HAD superfamily
MRRPSRRALLLDFGGPLLRTPFELLRATEQRLGLPPLTFDWRGPFDPAADPLWRRLQARAISEPEYWADRAKEFAAVTGASEVRAMMRELFRGDEDELVRPEAVAAMRAARALGCRIGVLTNDLTLFHDDEWIARIRVLTEVDAVIDGARLGVRKPDPAAYHAALERLGVTAAETVFADDQPINVDGARAVGIPAILFDVARPAQSYAGAIALLDAPAPAPAGTPRRRRRLSRGAGRG